MKFLQIAFIALVGSVCIATYATSQTLHVSCEAVGQEMLPLAPTNI